MKTTIYSIKILLKIILKITTLNQKIKILLITFFSIISSILQYIQAAMTLGTWGTMAQCSTSAHALLLFLRYSEGERKTILAHSHRGVQLPS